MRRAAGPCRVALLLLCGSVPGMVVPATAHELGIVQVTATFSEDGTYQIDVATDLEHLPPPQGPPRSLGALAAPLAPLRRPEREALEGFFAEFLDGASLQFDDRTVIPEVRLLYSGGVGATARLSGEIPPAARSFRWGNAMPVGRYLLTVGHRGDEAVARQWVEGGQIAEPFPLRQEVVPPSGREVVWLYFALGFTHIVPKGLDHILFVLGIFLLSQRLRPVLLQVTAFTLAHTLTLALAIYGVVRLSPSVVEPLIALSIVYVAVENLLTVKLRPWRVAIVFAFGLLHGLGFAGVLSEIGLPRSQFSTALLSFNVGVEAGQLAVIFGAFLAVGLAWRSKPWYRRAVVMPASLAIALVGLYWAVERTFG